MTEEQKLRTQELLEAADRGDAAAVDALISEDFTFESIRRVPISLPTGEALPPFTTGRLFSVS